MDGSWWQAFGTLRDPDAPQEPDALEMMRTVRTGDSGGGQPDRCRGDSDEAAGLCGTRLRGLRVVELDGAQGLEGGALVSCASAARDS